MPHASRPAALAEPGTLLRPLHPDAAGSHELFVRGAGEWIVCFLEKDMLTPVGRIRRFGSEDKLRELVARTPTRWVLADKQAFEYALKHGRGCVHLVLTTEQYRKLKG